MTHTAKSSPPDRLAAERVSSRYDLGELLGRGGMACVYHAIDRSSLRSVVLKQLHVDATAPGRASIAALFEREFHTLTQLRHPHVIEVYDYGVGDDGSPFYTMELLDERARNDRAAHGHVVRSACTRRCLECGCARF